MIYLYAAVDDPFRALRALGEPATGRYLVVQTGDLSFVGSYTDRPAPEASRSALADHSRCVQQLVDACAVVPFRFGTVIEGAGDLARRLGPRHTDIARLLPVFRGRVELALRARSGGGRQEAPKAASSGTAYLRALLTERSMAPELSQLHGVLTASAVAARADSDGGQIKAAYLVDRAGVEGFCDLVGRTAACLDGVSNVSVTGPWAPYSFVDETSQLSTSHGQ
jgi:Gas vesicle synthesis protein GvpL/GvpF